jgi:hypothetical protein
MTRTRSRCASEIFSIFTTSPLTCRPSGWHGRRYFISGLGMGRGYQQFYFLCIELIKSRWVWEMIPLQQWECDEPALSSVPTESVYQSVT